MEDLKYWLAFDKIPDLGPAKFSRIIKYFDDLESAWRANSPDLMSAGLSEMEASNIIIARSEINPEAAEEQLALADIKAVTINNSAYPKNLKEIYSPPPLLYYRGDISCLKGRCLAVVGSRRNSSYGESATKKIVTPLAESGMVIVSGLALGIDALAHQATLDANGLTVAILGSDLDWKNIGPKTNNKIAEKILDTGGALISTYPLGTSANKTTFPQRNRIISGLCQGTLIIEASESSGSLITANFALEQNRDIFAVPGSIYNPMSVGCNNLIKKGAKPIMSADDILEELSWQMTLKLDKKVVQLSLTAEENSLLDYLSQEPLSLDKLAEITNTRINALSAQLMILELKGVVKSIGGGNFVRNY